MLKLFSSAVALTLSLRGCTGGQQDCEKTIIFGSQCHNNPGSDCAFTIDPPVDGSDGIICYANTCTGVPTAVPQFGCLFQCQPTTVTKFPFCSRNDGGYWVCMTTDDETTPDKYECSSVTVCSDSVDLNLVASIYVSPNCDQLTNEETTTTTTTDTPSCPSCPKPTDPNFHQNRIIVRICTLLVTLSTVVKKMMLITFSEIVLKYPVMKGCLVVPQNQAMGTLHLTMDVIPHLPPLLILSIRSTFATRIHQII
jgi:hypothetical protein